MFVGWRRGDTMEIGVIGSVRGPLFSPIGRYSISWRTPGFISRPEFGVGQSAVLGALKFQSTGTEDM